MILNMLHFLLGASEARLTQVLEVCKTPLIAPTCSTTYRYICASVLATYMYNSKICYQNQKGLKQEACIHSESVKQLYIYTQSKYASYNSS